MMSSIDFGGFKYEGNRGAGYFVFSAAPENWKLPSNIIAMAKKYIIVIVLVSMFLFLKTV